MGEPAVQQIRDYGMQISTAKIAPDSLPQPALWKLLIEPIKVEEMTKGGILMPDQMIEEKEYLRYVGKVLAVGPGAYRHHKFEGIEAACQVGDWVIYNSYTGFDVRVNDVDGKPVRLRIINDDEVQAVAPNPDALLV